MAARIMSGDFERIARDVRCVVGEVFFPLACDGYAYDTIAAAGADIEYPRRLPVAKVGEGVFDEEFAFRSRDQRRFIHGERQAVELLLACHVCDGRSCTAFPERFFE